MIDCFFLFLRQVFVQLDELYGIGEEREWKETARWIKYEEDVEEGADRWGRPHVASLSFHSLLNLRRCLETGELVDSQWMLGQIRYSIFSMSRIQPVCLGLVREFRSSPIGIRLTTTDKEINV